MRKRNTLRLKSTGPLSPTQAKITYFVALGEANREIAEHERISPRTVKAHIEASRERLEARNRTHLVTQAFLRGVLTFSLMAVACIAMESAYISNLSTFVFDEPADELDRARRGGRRRRGGGRGRRGRQSPLDAFLADWEARTA